MIWIIILVFLFSAFFLWAVVHGGDTRRFYSVSDFKEERHKKGMW